MEHNPHNFEPGQVVMLDEKFQNGSTVKIIQLSEPNQMFATVQSEDPLLINTRPTWDVMTCRLSPLKQH